MLSRCIAVFIVSYSALRFFVAAEMQEPATQAAANPVPAQAVPTPKPANLKVLPKDISAAELNTLMLRYQQELGAPCAFCHAENPETKQIDFASDENPAKETARIMIAMTSDINNKYLAQLGDRRYAVPITCGNCHRGQINPPKFEAKP